METSSITAISKKVTLPVMEAFYTIQGEGFHQGRAAYFIRLGGCDVGCVWCDVKESWPAEAHPKHTIFDIVEEARKFPARLAVITGGEPAMYDLTILTATLKEAGFEVNIETSGAYKLTGTLDWTCVSPKKFKAPLDENLMKADELKVIIYNKSDFDWAEKYAAQVKDDCQLYLQPEWSRERQMVPLIIDYIKNHPKWQISLQLHKYMNIP